MTIIAIDPGTEKSGVVIWDGSVLESFEAPNEDLLRRIYRVQIGGASLMAVEMIASYGMPVGKEVFETCLWIGRFIERSPVPFSLIYRKDVKIHLCGTTKAKDGNIRQALIDKHGPVGVKKAPGRLYGISGHLWAALAVADYAASTQPAF